MGEKSRSDRWGQLVGLNGQGKPLWEMNNYYEDGTLPEPWMQELIDRFSWGIPSDRFADLPLWEVIKPQYSILDWANDPLLHSITPHTE